MFGFVFDFVDVVDVEGCVVVFFLDCFGCVLWNYVKFG